MSSELQAVIKHKAYRAASGTMRPVLDEFAIELKTGEVVALMGPSGCGKTTILRIIAGLDRDFAGQVRRPAQGRIGMVFQEPRLLPWRSVEDNVRLAAPRATEDTLTSLFSILDLTDHRRHYPTELSLGLARRVALARAFAVEPELLLLDEPFVSLDAALAARLRMALCELVGRSPVTTLLVTHDLEDAIGLADRLLILSGPPGRLVADLPIGGERKMRTARNIGSDVNTARAAIKRAGLAACDG